MLSTGLSRFLPPGSKSNPDAQTRTPRRPDARRTPDLSGSLPVSRLSPPGRHRRTATSLLSAAAHPRRTRPTLVPRPSSHAAPVTVRNESARRNRTPAA
ncbi:hypothetical protein ACS0TY_014705 [Phlomoides rotata]